RTRSTPTLPWQLGYLITASALASSTEAGALVVNHLATARPLPKELRKRVQAYLSGSNSSVYSSSPPGGSNHVYTPSSLVFKITAPVRAMPASFFFIVPNKSRPPHGGGGLPTGPLPALHPFWVGRASVGIFIQYQREGVWPPTNDLACSRPNIRRIFSGIWFEPGTLRPQ
ncbi:hypothetical protein AVEN_51883-1, partial [Araneus ventricosus]